MLAMNSRFAFSFSLGEGLGIEDDDDDLEEDIARWCCWALMAALLMLQVIFIRLRYLAGCSFSVQARAVSPCSQITSRSWVAATLSQASRSWGTVISAISWTSWAAASVWVLVRSISSCFLR